MLNEKPWLTVSSLIHPHQTQSCPVVVSFTPMHLTSCILNLDVAARPWKALPQASCTEVRALTQKLHKNTYLFLILSQLVIVSSCLWL